MMAIMADARLFDRRIFRAATKHGHEPARWRRAVLALAESTPLCWKDALSGCEAQARHTGNPELELGPVECRALQLGWLIGDLVNSMHQEYPE